jgi:hypothetical protein
MEWSAQRERTAPARRSTELREPVDRDSEANRNENSVRLPKWLARREIKKASLR